jgi:hypothetical protein
MIRAPSAEVPADAGRRLHGALTENQKAPQTVLRFLNNNDTGRRFITRYGRDMVRPAAVLQHMRGWTQKRDMAM